MSMIMPAIEPNFEITWRAVDDGISKISQRGNWANTLEALKHAYWMTNSVAGIGQLMEIKNLATGKVNWYSD